MKELTEDQKAIKKEWEDAGFKIEKSSIPIITNHIVTTTGEHIISIKHHSLIDGVLASGKTKEEADIKALAMLQIMLNFHQNNSKRLDRLAIFQGNRSKNQIWFKIIGVGLIIYIRPKHYKPKNLKSSRKGFWIGNKIRINILNSWKKVKL